ncbi:MAG: hypothetical protein Fur005_22120 [Roseiflexaceae bacterium]
MLVLMNRLQTQLILALLAPMVLVSLLSGLLLIDSRRTALLANEQRRAAQAGEAAALLAHERLRAGQQLLGLLAERQIMATYLVDADLVQLRRLLASAQTETLFDCLQVFQAQQLISAAGDCRLHDLPPTDLHLVGAAPQRFLAQISTPILLAADQPGYSLVGTLPLEQGLIELAQQQPDLELALLLNDQVVSASLPARREIADLPPVDREVIIAEVAYLQHTTMLRDPANRPVATIEVLVPLQPIRAAQRSATLIILGAMLVTGMVAIVIGWQFARRITRPLKQLRQAAQAIGAGQIDRPWQIDGAAEISELGQAVEQMRQQIAQHRQKLIIEQRRYADILESIHEAVLTLDPDQRITSINRGAEAMFGCQRQAVIGLPLALLITPDHGAQFALTQIPQQASLRMVVRLPSQQQRTLSITRAQSPYTEQQILVLRDVSEDAAVRQLKDAFLANITHEFRTPLAAQIASLEILRDEDEHLTSTERRQMLDALQSGVQRLDLLVQNLLDSASIEAGYFHIEPEPCSIVPILAEAISMIEPLTRQRGQQIIVAYRQPPPAILGDGRRLVQVFLNLLANASKFGPAGDSITLEITPQPPMLAVRVQDHGPGIPAERQQRLFDRFVRPGTDTVRAQGAGLGLAIVKAIIDRHGGEIHLEQPTIGGTIMVLTLPIALSGGDDEDSAG